MKSGAWTRLARGAGDLLLGWLLAFMALGLLRGRGAQPPAQGAVDTPQFDGGMPKVEGLKAAAEAAKQLITLSVGMLGLTITFLEKIDQTAATGHRVVSPPMMIAWGAYVLSILGALGTLLGVSGTLTTLDRAAMKLPLDPERDTAFDVYSPTVRIPMLVMLCSFMVAVVATILAAGLPATKPCPATPAASPAISAPAKGALPPAKT